MHSLFKRGLSATFSKLTTFKTYTFRPIMSFSTTMSNRTKSIRPDILYAGAAVLISLGGISYEMLRSKEEPEKILTDHIEEVPGPKLTKKEAKVIIQKAIEQDSLGNNEEALELYKDAYRVYSRAQKASNKKLTFLRHRIAILESFRDKPKRAATAIKEAFEGAHTKILNEELHFELYYDLCLLYYKFGLYIAATNMWKTCLNLANLTYPNDKELLAAIHQCLGFSYYRRGQIEKGKEHLTACLKYLNNVKQDNKVFLYYACNEFCDFYTAIGDYKKALLFLEQARIVLNQDQFFSEEMIKKGMKMQSPYVRKYIQDMRKDVQNEKVEHKARILRYKLGDYNQKNEKKNHTINKLTKEEKDHVTHGLLYW